MSQRIKLDDEAIKLAYKVGKSTHEIGKAYHVSKETINRSLKKSGAQMRSRSDYHALTKEQIAEAAQFYIQGKSTAELSELYKVNRITILINLKKIGTEMRQSQFPIVVANIAPGRINDFLPTSMDEDLTTIFNSELRINYAARREDLDADRVPLRRWNHLREFPDIVKTIMQAGLIRSAHHHCAFLQPQF